MKNTKSKILSLLLAMVMILGSLAPVVSKAAPPAEGEGGAVNQSTEQAKGFVTGKLDANQLSPNRPETTTLNIYKLTTQEAFSKNAPWDHNGGKIDPKEYANLGKEVKALAGAQFTIYKINGTDDAESEKILNTLKDNASKFETVDQMNDLITKGSTELAIEKSKLAKATGEGLTEGHTADTTTAGLATVKLGEGYYWVIESKIPEKVVGQIAVPFGLTLPLMNRDDVVSGETTIEAGTQYLTTVNVYPKNTQTDKVKIDKNFAKYDTDSKKWLDPNTGAEIADKDLGADYNKYQEAKKAISGELGRVIPYHVKTELPRNYKFETISWSDIMSEGLTFNQESLEVKVTYKATADAAETTTTTIITKGALDTTNGFGTLTPKASGFDFVINKKVSETAETVIDLVKWLENGKVTFELNYSATVNKDTLVDKPQNNDITFVPGKPNPGGKVTPSNGEITVTKTWANEDKTTEPKDETTITYYLEDASGKVVASVTLNSTTKRLGETIEVGSGIKFVVDAANWYSGKFTGLEAKEYTIKEAVDGYEPEFTPGQNGQMGIKNTENPDVLKPKEPKVEYHGKKFVKADNLDGARLAGAEFKIYKKVMETVTGQAEQKEVKKYLVAKDGTTAAAEAQAVTKAKAALDKAIEDYNKLTEEQQKNKEQDPAKSALAAINTTQKAYNKAVKDASNKYEWGDKANAITLVSDAEGRFEITGLEYGTYYLEETKAPAGYAKNAEDVSFVAKHGSYTDQEVDISYDPVAGDAAGTSNAKRINNKKVTIPQTGGIGTAIFFVVGAALMGGAIFTMKRREAVEEA